MHYPWWFVPNATSPMMIAAMAVLHVLISHYAVGGGIFLAFETSHAYRTNNSAYLDYLRGHAKFFVLLTVVLGAVTGVGIWWTIGLASPLATEMLIRTFVFGWAIEWVFFVVELVAAFIFLYYWGRLPEKTHVRIGWIYAGAAWISLVLITGITAFMLNSRGMFGDWAETGNFWHAFLNLQFIPQTIYRTGAALLLASLYVYVHAAWTLKDESLRRLLQKRSSRPAILGAGLVLVGLVGWYVTLPETARLTLEAAAAINVFLGFTIATTVVLGALIYFGPMRNPEWLSPGFAIALFLMGLCAFSASEFIREAIRKPYIVDRVILGNQVYVDEIPKIREAGYLEYGEWTRKAVEQKAPDLLVDGRIDEKQLLTLPPEQRVELGRVLFQHHCNDCHAGSVGYSAVGPLLAGQSRESIRHLVGHLDESHYIMPPWCGTPEEAEILTDYLMTIRPPAPERFPLDTIDESGPESQASNE